MTELLINFIPAIGITFLFQLIIHEIGHMLFGFLTGWKIVYIQLFRYALIKNCKGIKLKAVRTSGFQCIMNPKTIEDGALLYTLGGCIMNLIFTVIPLVMMLIKHDNIVFWFYAWCLFMFGVMMLLMNAIPNTKRVCNDMACYLLLNDRVTKQCHNAQLLIAKRLMDGLTYGKMERELFPLSSEHALNDITAYHVILEYYHMLETEDRKIATEKITSLIDTQCDAPISQGVRNIIGLEFLFKDILIKSNYHEDAKLDEETYGQDIDAYIDKYFIKGDAHSIRVKVAYQAYKAFCKGDTEGAVWSIDRGIEEISALSVIYPGEAIFCVKQLNKQRGCYDVEHNIDYIASNY